MTTPTGNEVILLMTKSWFEQMLCDDKIHVWKYTHTHTHTHARAHTHNKHNPVITIEHLDPPFK